MPRQSVPFPPELRDAIVRRYAKSKSGSQSAFCKSVLGGVISQSTLSRILRGAYGRTTKPTIRDLRKVLAGEVEGDGNGHAPTDEMAGHDQLFRIALEQSGQSERVPLDPLGRRAELIDAGLARLADGVTVQDLGLFVSLARELDVESAPAAAALASIVRSGTTAATGE